MGRKGQIFCAEEFQVIYVDILPSRSESITAHSFIASSILTSFQRVDMEMGKHLR